MSYSDGYLARSRRPLLPSFSNRTMHHPSFLPLYMAADFGLHHHHLHFNNQTVQPIIPAEFFYTDTTMSCGRRIPNIMTDLRVFDCFQLNTPSPVMSACLAPANHPDPFRSGPHPTRDLGSPTCRMHTHHQRVQPRYIVLQLTQEEDQAVTNLLKLHHQIQSERSDTFSSAQMDFPSVVEPPQDFSSSLFYQRAEDCTLAEEAYKPLCSDVQCLSERQQGGGWSDTEIEAANTLLNCSIVTQEDRIWGQNHQHHGKSSVSTGALPALVTSCSTHNDVGNVSFSCAREDREAGWRDVRSTEDEVVSGEMRGRTLTDLERDALDVLLSLGTMGTLDMVQ